MNPFKGKHYLSVFSNCWFCVHADPDGKDCAHALDITVAVWRRDVAEIGARAFDGPNSKWPRDKKCKGCPAFAISPICIREERNLAGDKINKVELE